MNNKITGKQTQFLLIQLIKSFVTSKNEVFKFSVKYIFEKYKIYSIFAKV